MSDITVSSSSIINGPAEKVWKTLRAFGGIESFNPLVTSSELEGAVVSVSCKRVCYVSLDSGKNVLRTEEVLNSLDNQNRTMSYTVTSAPGTLIEYYCDSYFDKSDGGDCDDHKGEATTFREVES